MVLARPRSPLVGRGGYFPGGRVRRRLPARGQADCSSSYQGRARRRLPATGRADRSSLHQSRASRGPLLGPRCRLTYSFMGLLGGRNTDRAIDASFGASRPPRILESDNWLTQHFKCGRRVVQRPHMHDCVLKILLEIMASDCASRPSKVSYRMTSLYPI